MQIVSLLFLNLCLCQAWVALAASAQPEAAKPTTKTPAENCQKHEETWKKLQCISSNLESQAMTERQAGMQIAGIMKHWDSGTKSYALSLDWGLTKSLRVGWGYWMNFAESYTMPLKPLSDKPLYIATEAKQAELIYLVGNYLEGLPQYASGAYGSEEGVDGTFSVYALGSGSHGVKKAKESCAYLKELLKSIDATTKISYVVATGDWCPEESKRFRTRVMSANLVDFGDMAFLEGEWERNNEEIIGNVPSEIIQLNFY